ncbi:MAG: Crp/Fnr family transcriptional regulator [Gammaproteobacteria bacterium]|nr:MAG: Crp/Fnr family transcriptional regulator [Gammaproteobacteria bacterium]
MTAKASIHLPDEVLAGNRWFAGLSASLRAALIEAAAIRAVATGRWLYGSGDVPRGLYAVIDGTALVYVALPEAEDVLVHAAGPGEIFGHAAQLARGPRLATVLAAEPSTFLFLSEQALARVASRHPDIWQHLTRLLYEQLGEALLTLARTLAQPASERLALRLLQLSKTGSGTPVAIGLSQSEFAELLGVSRKTVNRLLQALVREGAIELHYRRIVVRDASILRAMLD